MLFEAIGEVSEQKIVDGFSIQLGFCIYYLIQSSENEYFVEVADLLNDPYTNKAKDLSLPLLILSQELYCLKTYSLEVGNIFLTDTVIIEENIFAKSHIYLERKQIQDNHDSGWFIGSMTSCDTKYRSIKAFELVSLRPELLKILAFPRDSLIIFKDKEIEVVSDKNNVEIAPV